MTTTIEQIGQFLNRQNWPYETDSEHQRIHVTAEGLQIILNLEEDGEFLRCFIPELLTIEAQHPYAETAMAILQRLGGEVKLVRWQRDPADGEVRVTAEIPLEDGTLTERQFRRTLTGLVDLAGWAKQRLETVLATGEDPGMPGNPGNGSSDDIRQFLLALMQAEMTGDEESVYRVLSEHLSLLDQHLIEAITTLAHAVYAQGDLEQSEAMAALIQNLSIRISDFTGGNFLENQKIAIAGYQLTLEARPRERVPHKYAQTLTNLGNAYLTRAELGDNPAENLTQAIAAYDEAGDIFRNLKLFKDLATTLTNLGNAYLTRADLNIEPQLSTQKAIKFYREALQFFPPKLQPANCLKTAKNLARLAMRRQDWVLALDASQQAIEAIEQSRAWAKTEALRQEIVHNGIGVYENAIQAAVNCDRLDLALQIVERVRSKRLVDLMATADLYADGNVPESVRQKLDELERLQQQINQLRHLWDRSSDSPTGDSPKSPELAATRYRAATQAFSDEILALETAKQRVLDELSQEDIAIAKLQQVVPLELAQMQSLLDKPTVALLSFYTTDDDTHIFILRGDGSLHRHTCAGQGFNTLQRWLLDTWVRPYARIGMATNEAERDALNAQWQQQMPQLLKELSQRLELDRLIADRLQNIEEPILIPHLYLHQIPFVALPTNTGDYFGDRFLLRYAPGCQVLSFCHSRPPVDPTTYGTVENASDDLPFSTFEGDRVAKIFEIPPERRLRGRQAATCEAYRELLEGCTNLLSTHHAQTRFDNPLESALYLGNGTITVSQLLSPGWRFPQLSDIFLSCCETGLTLPQNLADEPIALGTGFLCAGARAVLSSQWSVGDLSAALLSGFYHQARRQGCDRPHALQQAQRQLRDLTGEEFRTKYVPELLKQIKAEKQRLYKVQKQAEKEGNTEAANACEIGRTKLGIAESYMQICGKQAHPFAHPVHWAAFLCQGLG